jgi:DNA (cytosine-5)-methyltransferase 1
MQSSLANSATGSTTTSPTPHRNCILVSSIMPQTRHPLTTRYSPGESLPEFPPFTHYDPHTPRPGLIPWVSVNSVLCSIPHNAPDHDLAAATSKRIYKVPWSDDSIAPRCITTHGGQNYHPSGKRGFTNREFAALQGFPHNHVFSHYNVKKQIGNAVPPSIAKVLFEWIRKWLEKVDGVKEDYFQLD